MTLPSRRWDDTRTWQTDLLVRGAALRGTAATVERALSKLAIAEAFSGNDLRRRVGLAADTCSIIGRAAMANAARAQGNTDVRACVRACAL